MCTRLPAWIIVLGAIAYYLPKAIAITLAIAVLAALVSGRGCVTGGAL